MQWLHAMKYNIVNPLLFQRNIEIYLQNYHISFLDTETSQVISISSQSGMGVAMTQMTWNHISGQTVEEIQQ